MFEIIYNPSAWGMLYGFIGVFALAVGSLLNVVIYRMPLALNMSVYPQTQLEQRKVNLCYPRSFCPFCKTMIALWYNIPLISYILLSGRCKYCKHTIPLRYPVVELSSALLACASAWQFGLNLKFLFVLLFIWILIALFFIDLEQGLLPDTLTLGLLWLGLFANTAGLFTNLSDAVYSSAAAFISLWLFVKIFYLFTGKIGMGNGDLKLFAAFGAWFGYKMLPLILFGASMMGSIVAAIYLIAKHKSKDTPIPFGPFLCTAGVIALWYGNNLLNWLFF